MFSARDCFGSPGIKTMLPEMMTTNFAPAESAASEMCKVQPVGAPGSFGSSVKLYCVFAMHTGNFA